LLRCKWCADDVELAREDLSFVVLLLLVLFMVFVPDDLFDADLSVTVFEERTVFFDFIDLLLFDDDPDPPLPAVDFAIVYKSPTKLYQFTMKLMNSIHRLKTLWRLTHNCQTICELR
jgi:hypothetical protein